MKKFREYGKILALSSAFAFFCADIGKYKIESLNNEYTSHNQSNISFISLDEPPKTKLEASISDSLKENPIRKIDSSCYPRTSKIGIELIKSFEGYSAVPYLCQAGKQTIGYGHMLKQGEYYPKINREEAEEILRRDLLDAERTIERNVRVSLNQNQYDALVSFVFNVGPRNFQRSTLLAKLNSGDYMGAGEELLRWNKANGKPIKGLTNRRLKERELFFSSH